MRRQRQQTRRLPRAEKETEHSKCQAAQHQREYFGMKYLKLLCRITRFCEKCSDDLFRFDAAVVWRPQAKPVDVETFLCHLQRRMA
jgi:hypothetical protein